MDSDDDVYDSYDGGYSEEEYMDDGGDEFGGVSEDIDEDGGVQDDSHENGGAPEDCNDNGDAEDEFWDHDEENMGVLEDGAIPDDNEENGGASDESEEDEESGDYGVVDNAADDEEYLEDRDDGDCGFVYSSGGDSSSCRPQGTYTLEFDGASKGNPGKSGAGAILRYPDGSVANKIMKNVGVATNNVAEYEALNVGLRYAQSQGIDRIQVKGDSKLVCKQVNGDWKTRSKNLADLNMKAKDLKSGFKEFRIDYVPRESNAEADALANDAVKLPAGKWCDTATEDP